MNGISTDSAKVLTEKLSLARQLATLKPELEHLRSQTLSQQNLLAEKLSLERQVSTLEVELETEKRASKRATQKSQTSEREAELQNQLDSLQKDLMRERRERDKSRKELEMDLQNQLDEAQKALAREKRAKEKMRKEVDAEFQTRIEELQTQLAREKRGKQNAHKDAESDLQSQIEDLHRDLAQEKQEREKARKEAEKELKALQTRDGVLEGKLDQFRTKLRLTKEELNECQAELSNARATIAKSGSTISKGEAPAKKGRKRGAMDMSTDGDIGTPDGVAVRGKRAPVQRGRADQTMVGEKSMFSITPFLNRTINIALGASDEDNNSPAARGDESPQVEDQAQEQPLNTASDDTALTPTARTTAKAPKKAIAKPPVSTANILGESKASLKNRKPPAKKVPKSVNTLENVTEEYTGENEEPDTAPSRTMSEVEKPIVTNVKASKVQAKNVENDDGAKKKKRKLLGGGKTLFDEDEVEVTKRPAKVALGPSRLLGKGGLAGPKGGLKGGLGVSAGFGTFSPLKKDRRGVGASFLA